MGQLKACDLGLGGNWAGQTAAFLHPGHQGQLNCAAQERGRVSLLSAAAGKGNLRIFTSKLDGLFVFSSGNKKNKKTKAVRMLGKQVLYLWATSSAPKVACFHIPADFHVASANLRKGGLCVHACVCVCMTTLLVGPGQFLKDSAVLFCSWPVLRVGESTCCFLPCDSALVECQSQEKQGKDFR